MTALYRHKESLNFTCMWCVPCTMHLVFLELANYLGLPQPWRIIYNDNRSIFCLMPCGFLKTCLCLWWGYVLCNLFHVRWCALLTLLDWKLEVRIITRGQMLHDFLHDFSHTSSIGFIWQCLIWKWQEENNKHEPKTASSKTASVTWFVTWTVTYIILHTSSPNTNPGLKRLPFELIYT